MLADMEMQKELTAQTDSENMRICDKVWEVWLRQDTMCSTAEVAEPLKQG